MLHPGALLRVALVLSAGFICVPAAEAQSVNQTKGSFQDRFRQLDEVWPTPNVYRTASGAPGPEYWQQRADYHIKVRLDDEARRLTGSEVVTYTNNSPDRLVYLWFQLEQNRFDAKSHSRLTETDEADGRMSFDRLEEIVTTETGDFGINVSNVRDGDGTLLNTQVVDTMMRVDLPKPLEPGEKITLSMDFAFNVIPGEKVSNRNGYEILKDGNANYFLSLFYPRLAAYTDYQGWVTKAFLYVEYALEFGDFTLEITVPDTFAVAATGELDNPAEVLTLNQRQRLERARLADKPIYIITPEEAKARAETKALEERTWIFRARNVRDIAFAASASFIWDAMAVPQADGRPVMAMSAYPPEGMPLWNKYSTHAIAHAIDVFGAMTIPYPYPVAWSINAPIRSGMEFPMMAANAPRPSAEDGTYTKRDKYGLIGVVIHEVGHNWFPMIINSSERDYIWMDEGLNSFVQAIAEDAWEADFPMRRHPPASAIAYMLSTDQQPIMTQGDALTRRGPNAYTKVAAALTVLREVVLGRDLFDRAFRTYSRRWAFKRPTPSDFFRTMEDASGMDLDWFWRGWFYTTDHVDVSVDELVIADIDTRNPDREQALARQKDSAASQGMLGARNKNLTKRVDRFPDLRDFYNENDDFTVTDKMRGAYQTFLEGLEDWEKDLLASSSTVQFVRFTNHGGLPTPLPLRLTFKDGSTEELTIPATIWRKGEREVVKPLLRSREITRIEFDPQQATADADTTNNTWPRPAGQQRLELTKPAKRRNLMKEVREDERN